MTEHRDPPATLDEPDTDSEVIEKLRAALRDVFALIDEGWLIRNTANDAESGWGMRQLSFVRRLQSAYAALGDEQYGRGPSSDAEALAAEINATRKPPQL